MTLIAACSSPFKDKSEAQDPITQAALEVSRVSCSTSEACALAHGNTVAREAQIRRSLRQGELTLGMGKSDVLSVWGQPRTIETAGNPELGNQRWVYFTRLSERLGSGPQRMVYFEGGRVAGWEIQ